MKEHTIAVGLLVILVVGIIVVLAGNFNAEIRPVPTPVLEETIEKQRDETVEEQMNRWDRGEFTEAEITEIRTEEEREDAALENGI
jgi:hypothetical protein